MCVCAYLTLTYPTARRTLHSGIRLGVGIGIGLGLGLGLGRTPTPTQP